MKKIVAIIVLIAVLAGGCYLFYAWMPMTAGNISQVRIEDLKTHQAQSFSLDKNQAETLMADLKGTAIQALPAKPLNSFEITITHAWVLKKTYRVYYDGQHRVAVQNMNTGKLTAVTKPGFLYNHAGFNSLYPYGSLPEVRWSLDSKPMAAPAAKKTWSYQKWDGQWYSTTTDTPASRKTIKITRADEGISLSAKAAPTDITVEAKNSAGQVVLQEKLQGPAIPLVKKDGLFHYTVTMNWNPADQPYKGNFTYQFDLSMDLPAAFEFSKLTVSQGDVVQVRVYYANPEEVPELKQELFKKFQFYKNGDAYQGYLPTGYLTKPGSYTLEYGISGKALQKAELTVNPYDFRIQYLTIDPKVEASTRSDAAYAQYNKYFYPAIAASSEEQYYTGPFTIPAPGRLSTEFGETRYVNGEPTSYHHSGLDIANAQGTPILAANDGKVVLSMFFTLTGNTIVIDHGQGLFSVYYHMVERKAEQGTVVKKGQQIGAMGTTGFSTGSHLHFSMCFYDRFIQPGYFLAGEPITKKNYLDYLK